MTPKQKFIAFEAVCLGGAFVYFALLFIPLFVHASAEQIANGISVLFIALVFGIVLLACAISEYNDYKKIKIARGETP